MNKLLFSSMIAFVMSLITTQNVQAQPSNDNCTNATVLTSSATCNYTSGTVDGATDDNLPQPSCDAYSGTYAGEGVWYQFTPQYASNIIKVDGSSSLDPVLVVYTGSCGSLVEFDCNDTTGFSHATISNSNFVVGDTYYIRVYDYGSVGPQDGSFDICIQHNASGGTVDLEYVNHITLDGVAGNGTGDGDNFGEPGEQIVLAINISNNGNTTAHNVSGTLSTSDNDITITNATTTWPDILAGGTEMATGLAFTISNTAFEKDVIFTLDITSDEGSANESFLFHIYDGNISLHKNDILIRDGNGGGTGNSNGQLDGGENINLEVKIHNSGSSIAHNVSTELSTMDADINITTATVSLGDLNGGADVWAQSFVFDISANCPDKDVVFNITTTSDEGSWVDTFTLHVTHTTNAIGHVDMEKINIYPNPASQYLHVKNHSDRAIETIEIFNINGQRIFKTHTTDIINVAGFKQGLYILKITDEEGSTGDFKFIKK